MKLIRFSADAHLASLFLRISVGSMFLLHGIGKLFFIGIEKVLPGFVQQGFPEWAAYVSSIVELIAGLLLIIGLYSRVAVLLLMPVAIGVLIYHVPNGWVFHNPGGGWEYPKLIIVSLVSIFLLGTGKYGMTNY